MRISDWSSDVCSSDLGWTPRKLDLSAVASFSHDDQLALAVRKDLGIKSIREIRENKIPLRISTGPYHLDHPLGCVLDLVLAEYDIKIEDFEVWGGRSEEHTSELQSLMRTSYAVFCLKYKITP